MKVGRRWTDPGRELGDGQRGVGGVLSQECHQLKADRERKVPVDMRLRRIRDHLTLAGIGGGFMCGRRYKAEKAACRASEMRDCVAERC